MPTIEIVSVGANGLGLDSNDFELAFIEESKIKSHRGIFYNWLINQRGVIVHLGNPEFKNDTESGFFAGELIDWDLNQENNKDEAFRPTRFKFLETYWKEVVSIIEKAKESSPQNEAYFLTDIQFEPDKGEIIEIKFSEFYSLYNSKGLSWNTLYKLK